MPTIGPTSVVEAAPNAMLMIDSERRIVLVNRAAEQLFGYARTELIERAIEMLIPQRLPRQPSATCQGLS